MIISVDEQPKKFYVEGEKEWTPAIGHEIEVGEYRFWGIPFGNQEMGYKIKIAEVTSGKRITNFTIPEDMLWAISDKKDKMTFLKKVGSAMAKIIDKTSDFPIRLAESKKEISERLGCMPPVEDYHFKYPDEKELENGNL